MPLRRPPDTIFQSMVSLTSGGFRYAKNSYCVFCSAPPGPASDDRMLVCRTPDGYISCGLCRAIFLSRNSRCGYLLCIDSRFADRCLFTFSSFCLCRCGFIPTSAAVDRFFQNLRFCLPGYRVGCCIRFRWVVGSVPVSVFKHPYAAPFLLVLSAMLPYRRYIQIPDSGFNDLLSFLVTFFRERKK